MAKTFDETVKKMCRKKMESPDSPLLKERYSVEEAIAEALIRKALSGASDAVKLLREILGTGGSQKGNFQIDIKVVD